jgi:hypothetical protein
MENLKRIIDDIFDSHGFVSWYVLRALKTEGLRFLLLNDHQK